ncbi:DUF4097 family beta strand repeat protein [Streptomyces sp. ISL-10]|uniref:DUF4097 family beta strand repeat-containing protein n=1 Tax=Streptomyces sp. ISL-10 TaxID=2819172 RepID=UPI001BE947FB|nr:DUF4097 family beta strand repeat-containing protein [Streptomyces sp. ISL-10]MBT2366265.1 DUF4097 family beta strand repeat protein [Streptomyces sp. ISL-10]
MAVSRHRRHRLVPAAAVVVAVLGVGGCGRADAREASVERKAFAFSGTALTVDADGSALEIVPDCIEDVQVTRQIDGWVVLGSGPEASWVTRDGTLTLEVACEAVASDCEARHTVKVPRDVAVTVVDDKGSVTAEGFTAALKITSDSGSVPVRDSSGPLRLACDNGRIVAERITSRTVTATSANGSVRLGLTAVPDRVETVSDNGRIHIELPASRAPYAVSAESGDADVGNGDVGIAVPTDDDSAPIVTARSDNGEVVVRSAN